MKHQPAREGPDEVCQQVPVVANSIRCQIVLNQFNGNGINDCNHHGDNSDFIQQKREAPQFDESEHDEEYQDRKNKGVSQLICRNAEQSLSLEPAVT